MVGALKRLARPVVEAAIATVGKDRWPSRHSRLVVLTYHRVLPKDDPEWEIEQPGMLVTPETLRMHLEVIKRRFEVVHLDEWVENVATGKGLPKLACAITFDDGWRDNYDYAYPVLRALDVPAMIFLVTDRVGTRESFWPNRLARLLTSWPGRVGDFALTGEALKALGRLGLDSDSVPAGMSREAINRAIEAAKYDSDASLGALLDELEDAVGVNPSDRRDLLNWSEAKEMLASGLIRFGSHTCSHTRLIEGLEDDLVTREVVDSRKRLERELGAGAELFCYPNGACSAAALKEVRSQYRGAVSTQTGWNDERSEIFMLKRIGLHEDVTAKERAFRARLTGWI